MAVAVSFWILYTLLWKKRTGKRLAAGILAAAVFSGAFVGNASLIKSEYNVKIQAQIQAEIAKQQQNQQTQQQTQNTGRQADIQADASNGRFALWESSVDIWKEAPVFGTGYNSFLPFVREHVPQSYVINNSQGDYVSLHNEYINILVYQGILGLGIFLAFGILTIIKWIKKLPSVKPEDRDYIGVLTACVLVVLLAMVFLMEGLYTNSPGAFLLWTFLGYFMHYFSGKAETVK